MARIIIVAYGSLGDLHPVMALAQALASRGHQAVIATSENYRRRVEALGLPFRAVRPDLSPANQTLVQRVMDGRRGSEFLMRELVFPAVRDMHADLMPLAAEADLLVGGELACAVPIVAEQRRLPWVYFSLSPLTFFSALDPSVIPGPAIVPALQALGPAGNRLVHRVAQIVSHSWWRPVRQLRQELGMAPGASPLFAGKFSPHLNLALFSPVLQPPAADWPSPTVQTGFLFHDEDDRGQLPTAVREFLAAGPPPVIFTLGSAAVLLPGNFYAHAVEAARALGRRALLLLGDNPPPPGLPPSILVWDYLPYAQVFPPSAAIVHQGGIGTTAQALRAGRPMLIVPFAHDQFDNAARVQRLGAGRQLPAGKLTSARLRQTLGQLLDDEPARSTAQEMGARIRAENGATTAAMAIERLLPPSRT